MAPRQKRDPIIISSTEFARLYYLHTVKELQEMLHVGCETIRRQAEMLGLPKKRKVKNLLVVKDDNCLKTAQPTYNYQTIDRNALKRRNCVKGKLCGSTCISSETTCRIDD